MVLGVGNSPSELLLVLGCVSVGVVFFKYLVIAGL